MTSHDHDLASTSTISSLTLSAYHCSISPLTRCSIEHFKELALKDLSKMLPPILLGLRWAHLNFQSPNLTTFWHHLEAVVMNGLHVSWAVGYITYITVCLLEPILATGESPGTLSRDKETTLSLASDIQFAFNSFDRRPYFSWWYMGGTFNISSPTDLPAKFL